MSYPYWPNGSVVGYQTLAFNSNTNVLTLAPGGNSVNLTTSGGGSTSNIVTNTIRASTIAAYQGGFGDYGLYVSTSATGPAQIRAESGSYAEIKAVGQNGEVGFIKGNTEIAIMRPNAGDMLMSIWNENPGRSIVDLVSYNSNVFQARTQLTQRGTSNSLILTTGAGDVAGIRMSDTGGGSVFAFPNMSTITAQAQTFVASQQTGENTQYQTVLFNGNTVDIANIMPMATVYSGSNTLEFSTDSKIAQFGTMAPGQIYKTIPGTTYAAASNVVLAPYTTFEMYTSGTGSGGSVVYVNQGNANFSTFTAQVAQNGTTYNSYKMFFGN